MSVQENNIAPEFELDSTAGGTQNLAALRGQFVVLFFYPKDNTPGCTTESCDFTANYAEFTANNAAIFGISKDSLRSHGNFKAKYEMPFELLSDPDEVACRAYDVIKEKKMYGKTFEGIERSTFLINPEGKIAKAWRKVKVPGHVSEVLESLKALSAG